MKHFFTSILLLFSISLFAQDGCGFEANYEKLKTTDPSKWDEFQKNQEQLNAFISNYIANQKISGVKKAQANFTIPVVFHILHNGGPENISYEQCESAIVTLNECFNGQNASISTIQAVFAPIVANPGIEFKMAKKAPDGSCFNGVTRTKSPESFSGNESAQLQAIINGNDVYNGVWRSDQYLNIFVVNTLNSPGAAAYAYFPSGTGSDMSNGVWTRHQYTGSIGTSSLGNAGVVVHELGHWFSLYHTWGWKDLVNNDPVPGVDCADGSQPADLVEDTPETIGNKSCSQGVNTCDGDNAYWGFDIVDNVENFMDYSYCFKMFTIGQGARMIATLNSTNGGRNNLSKASNLDKTGVNDPDILCKADFDADKYEICAGESITFKDYSYSTQNSWTWTFTGADVTTSNDQNPTVTYSTPGVYDVTLEVTDGSTSLTKTKTAFINVLPNPGNPVDFVESFETSNVPDINWSVSPDFVNDYNETTAAFVTGAKSLRISNSSSRAGNVYNLTSTTYDLSSYNNPYISFQYAFAKRSSSNDDVLRVYVSKDCGVTWTMRKSISTSSIATAPNTTSTFVPTSAQWAFIEMTNLTSDFATENFRVKFEFTSGGGNYFYLEDINIIGQGSSNVGLEDLSGVNSLQYYPNPTNNGELKLNISMAQTSSVMVNVYDVVGKKIETINLGNVSNGTTELGVNTSSISSGTYLFETVVNGVSVKKDKILIK